MRRVVVESPFKGRGDHWWQRWWDNWQNIRYARRCAFECVMRGEAPFASHLLYPQFLDDGLPAHRLRGMTAGFAWGTQAELVAVYVDRGITAGMRKGMDRAVAEGVPWEYRSLPR